MTYLDRPSLPPFNIILYNIIVAIEYRVQRYCTQSTSPLLSMLFLNFCFVASDRHSAGSMCNTAMVHAQVLRVSRALDHAMAVVAIVAKRVERGRRGRDHRCDTKTPPQDLYFPPLLDNSVPTRSITPSPPLQEGLHRIHMTPLYGCKRKKMCLVLVLSIVGQNSNNNLLWYSKCFC